MISACGVCNVNTNSFQGPEALLRQVMTQAAGLAKMTLNPDCQTQNDGNWTTLES